MQPTTRRYDDSDYSYGYDTEDEMPPSEYIDDEVVTQRVMQSTGILLSNGPYTSNPPTGQIEAYRYIDSLSNNTQVARTSEPRTTPARFPRLAHGRPAFMWMHQPPVIYLC